MFRSGKLYRHMNTLDIDLYVVKDFGCENNSAVVLVKYYNRNYKIFQGTSEIVSIKTNEFSKWSEIKGE